LIYEIIPSTFEAIKINDKDIEFKKNNQWISWQGQDYNSFKNSLLSIYNLECEIHKAFLDNNWSESELVSIINSTTGSLPVSLVTLNILLNGAISELRDILKDEFKTLVSSIIDDRNFQDNEKIKKWISENEDLLDNTLRGQTLYQFIVDLKAGNSSLLNRSLFNLLTKWRNEWNKSTKIRDYRNKPIKESSSRLGITSAFLSRCCSFSQLTN
jgi:hypothetical protein